ncbi:AsmA-like C-terminal region-containing protein [Marinifilum fragile]|uniref:AsmA-like C-terminal region-containing protein n=1 Tax=Marinifilum fragile TaxID=570161 RepID=UPI0006D28644|nr:AsmA-like C-terminal region-containing protein [Marinifilum fragile]
MKKFLKIFGGILVFLLALLIILPYFFKDQIFERVKAEIDNAVDAKVEIGDLSLSMLKNFPNLYIELQNVSVVGKNEFASDTLAFVGRLYTAVDLSSALSGSQIKVGTIVLADSKVKAKVLETGKANWDIVKSTGEEVVVEESGEASDFKVIFDEVKIENFGLLYDDASMKAVFAVEDLDLNLSGDFSAKETNLNVATTLTGISFDYEGARYLNNASMNLTANLAADLENMIFKFMENQLGINDLHFGIDGQVGMLDNGYSMDLKLNAEKTDFKSLLAMVPDVFKSDLEGLETSGEFELNAFAKGEYKEESYPAFGAKLKVDKASLKYVDLPESVQNIQIDAQVNHPGGELDLLTTDVNKFHFEVANNPFDAEIHVKNPMTDPLISGFFKGIVDFEKIKHAIPMDSINIAGMVNSDVVFKGRYSVIENEEFEKFMAKGSVVLNDFVFTTPDFPQGVKIIKSVLDFTPRYISLSSFDSRIGKSDIQLKGKIENYIPYTMKGKVLKGNFNLSSKMMDLNEFMAEETKEVENSKDTLPLSVIEVPANLDLRLSSNFNTIRFDKMDIEDVKGLIVVKNASAKLTNLSMNLLKGNMTMNGMYKTIDVTKPEIDFGLDINDFDINNAYHSLSMIKKMMPIAMNCEGKVSSDMNITGLLDTEMNPIPASLNGKGALHSRKILIKENKAFDALAAALKNDKYKRISVSQFDMEFEITNGNVVVKPFTTKIAGNPATVYGTQSVDGKLDFTMDMKLPKEDLGGDINKLFTQVPGLENVPAFDVAVKITGTVDNPIVKPDLSKAIKQAQKAIAKELERKTKKELEKKGKDLLKKLFK